MPAKISLKARRLLSHKKKLQEKVKNLDALLAETYSLYAYHQALLEHVSQEIDALVKKTPKDLCN